MTIVVCGRHCSRCGRHFVDDRSHEAHQARGRYGQAICESPAVDLQQRFTRLDDGLCYEITPPSRSATVWAAKPTRRTMIVPSRTGLRGLRAAA
jgi:hypothetical protein